MHTVQSSMSSFDRSFFKKLLLRKKTERKLAFLEPFENEVFDLAVEKEGQFFPC